MDETKAEFVFWEWVSKLGPGMSGKLHIGVVSILSGVPLRSCDRFASQAMWSCRCRYYRDDLLIEFPLWYQRKNKV